MSREYRAKVFRSGNSLAVRLPRELGFADGEDVTLIPHADGSFTFWRPNDAAAVLDGMFGAFSDGFMAAGRGPIEQTDRDWDHATGRAA
jgi:antitoxin VapB